MRLWQSEYSDRIYNLNYESLTIDQENQSRKLIKYLELNWEEAWFHHLLSFSLLCIKYDSFWQSLIQISTHMWHATCMQ